MQFQDHFSSQADRYARFRPLYPPALFAWLARQVPTQQLAWDCATGNGQAAVGLAAHFQTVIASDASAEQIAHARPHPQIRFLVANAEAPPAEARACDVATVAQALHWFDLDRFYPALQRTLKPGGLFAAWGYGLMRIEAAIDALVEDYYSNVVGPYWPPERQHIETEYRNLAFPFTEMPSPRFQMRTEWCLPDLFGYLESWSATTRYRRAHAGDDPLDGIRAKFARAWGDVNARAVTWPLFLRAGRVV